MVPEINHDSLQIGWREISLDEASSRLSEMKQNDITIPNEIILPRSLPMRLFSPFLGKTW
jgi:hypothetical protein